MTTTNWCPVTVAELEAAQRLYSALTGATTGHALDDPATAITALEQLGRTCIAGLAHPDSVPAQLIRSMSSTTAPVIAWWAGVDPDDEAAVVGLTEDLMLVRDQTVEVRDQLASVLLQTSTETPNSCGIGTAGCSAYSNVA